MERHITLSSFSVRGDGNNRRSDFTTKFSQPPVLDSNYQYEVGLNRIITMAFPWFYVTADYDNQQIAFGQDNETLLPTLILLQVSGTTMTSINTSKKLPRHKMQMEMMFFQSH